MKCKFYSKYIEGFGRDVCCYDKIKYNNPLLLCTHKGEEENCTCFKPKTFEYEGTTPLEGCTIALPKYSARISIGNLQINLTDKTFTEEQIKNMKEMLGWEVENL